MNVNQNAHFVITLFFKDSSEEHGERFRQDIRVMEECN